jgi:hypothetical protein
VGVLAAVVLAGLIFWGLDSDGVKGPSAGTVVAGHHPAETPNVKMKPPPVIPAAEKANADKPAVEPPPHGPNSSVVKPPKAPDVPAKINTPAETAPPSGRQAPGPPPMDEPKEAAKRETLALNVVPPPRVEPPAAGLPPKTPALPPVARVAIVVDDLGQDLDVARKVATIPLAITFSVLPFQDRSKDVVALALANGREVMLHMPMEPEGYPRVNPGNGALLLAMSPGDIHRNLRTALDATSPIAGINNHMGSRFTEHAEPMGIVMKELRRRGLFFLDSATTPRSAALDAARENGVPYLRRDIFLDHVLAESFVKTQLVQLIRKAKIQGTALGIGHPHEVTLDVLRRESGLFEREGIAVVPASRLVSHGSGRENAP